MGLYESSQIVAFICNVHLTLAIVELFINIRGNSQNVAVVYLDDLIRAARHFGLCFNRITVMGRLVHRSA